MTLIPWRRRGWRQFPGKPGPGEVPVAADCTGRNFKDLDDFFFLKAAEIAQLHNFGLARSDFGERGERVVQGDHRTVRLGRNDGGFIEIHAHRAMAAFLRAARPRGVHQNAPHHLRRNREELRALLPLYFRHIHQSQIDFVDQGGGLQRVVPPFAFHVAASQAP
jgi:hypothetical protein